MEDEVYDEIRPYSDGRAAVRKGSLWGYVDENGNLVSKVRGWSGKPGLPYSYAEPFLTSSLIKYVFYNWLINNILYLCVT